MEIDVWAPSVLHSSGCSPLSRLLKNATVAEEVSHLRVTYWPFSSLRPCTVKGWDKLCGFTWKKNSPGSGTCSPCLQVNKRGPVSSHPPADLGPSLWAIAMRIRGAQGTQCLSSGLQVSTHSSVTSWHPWTGTLSLDRDKIDSYLLPAPL